MQSNRFVFLVTVVFTSMFAGAAVANRLIRPDLSIPNDPSEIGAKSIVDDGSNKQQAHESRSESVQDKSSPVKK
jgi:hypothetical protein